MREYYWYVEESNREFQELQNRIMIGNIKSILGSGLHGCQFMMLNTFIIIIYNYNYHVAGNFCGVLIFVIFIVNSAVMKISTNKN